MLVPSFGLVPSRRGPTRPADALDPIPGRLKLPLESLRDGLVDRHAGAPTLPARQVLGRPLSCLGQIVVALVHAKKEGWERNRNNRLRRVVWNIFSIDSDRA